jgi:uncharacterized protein YbjQ (UPF0145 family)
MNLQFPITTLTTLSRPHRPLGIAQGYAQHQLGIGSRIGAMFSNLFGGSNNMNHSIGEKFAELKNEALRNLTEHANANFPGFDSIAGVQFELLTLEINQGQDTILVCNVTGTPVRFTKGIASLRNSRVAGGSKASRKKRRRD